MNWVRRAQSHRQIANLVWLFFFWAWSVFNKWTNGETDSCAPFRFHLTTSFHKNQRRDWKKLRCNRIVFCFFFCSFQTISLSKCQKTSFIYFFFFLMIIYSAFGSRSLLFLFHMYSMKQTLTNPTKKKAIRRVQKQWKTKMI